MNIASFLPQVASLHGDRPAISLGFTTVFDYRTLQERVRLLAGWMRGELGLAEGDRVGVAMINSPYYLEILLACWHAGLCAVPMNAKLHDREIAYILDNCGTRICFVTDKIADDVRRHQPELPTLDRVICVDDAAYADAFSGTPLEMVDVAPDSPAWIFYTSGTTGRPKGATLSHGNLMAMSLRYFADIDQLSETDCYLHAAPMSHGGGLYGLPHLMKGSHHIVTDSLGFDVDEIFDLMEVYDNLTFFTAPTMLTRMTNHPRAVSCRKEAIRTIYYGGAPMYLEDMKRALAVFGPRFYQIFGQGESPMTGIGLSKALHADRGHPRFFERLASTGVARTGVDVRIVDEDDNDVPVGELGEVLFRSDVVMLGYWGEEVVAFVVPHAGQLVNERDLDELCLANIARFKRPKQYFIVEQLPKSNYGKILKTELRRKLESNIIS
ncbi:MAG: AMP-binding protein [Rhizobiaceae bacterium]|nr:AMP-binding protein [Rhizobiaceae bacterium]